MKIYFFYSLDEEKNPPKYTVIVKQKKTKPLIMKHNVESPTSTKFNGRNSSNSCFEINTDICQN